MSPPYFLRHQPVHFFCSKIHKDIQCNQKTSFQQRMSTNCERRGNKSVRSMFHIAILFPVSSYSLLDLWSPVCRLLQFLSPLQSYHHPTAALLVYLSFCVYKQQLLIVTAIVFYYLTSKSFCVKESRVKCKDIIVFGVQITGQWSDKNQWKKNGIWFQSNNLYF